MVIFVAVRCFSCKMFQVNQQTKSGKWKCRMCGEGQSIVKVWGRGGHAKDVRSLAMELNAAAGRGEDPQVALRRGLGREPESQPQPQSQPSSLSQRPQPRHQRDPSVGMGHQGDGGRGFSPSNASQLRFAQGAEELRSVGQQANRGRSGGFVTAGLAPEGSGGGDETAVDAWGLRADGSGQLGFGGERPSEACQEAEGNSNFVTSLEDAAPARRGGKRSRHQVHNPAEEESGQSPSSRSLWAVGGETREDPNYVAASAGHAEAREEQQPPWRQNSNKSGRREWGSPSSAPLRADQVDEPPTMMSSWRGGSGGFEDRAGFVARDGGGCGGGGGGVSRGVFSGESNDGGNGGGGAQVAGGVRARGAGASSSSSRWSKFLR